MRSAIVESARHKVGEAIRSGKLVRPEKCSRCGSENKPMKDGRTSIQAHHYKGYDNPLDVEWLCVGCHRLDTPAPYGTRAQAAKADWAIVDKIRSKYGDGVSYYRIAKEVGLHPTTVHRIVTHRSWPEHARPQEDNQ